MDLLDKLKGIIPNGDKFISFDAVNLFTNIPLKPTLEFLRRKLPVSDIELPISVDCLLDLLELCTKNLYFQFQGIYYEHVFGFAMGNPLSPILANLFLEHIESEMLPTFSGIQPYFWVRYVDDVLSLVPANFDLHVFLDFINSLYPSLNFTFEWEDNGRIPFLDVLIHNNSDHLKFSVYRKPTNAEVYLHYFSFTASNIKTGIAQGLLLRALRICDQEYLQDEIAHIFECFKKLAYPEHVLSKALSKAKRSFYSSTNSTSQQPNSEPPIEIRKHIVVPYVPILEPFKSSLHYLGTGLVFKYNNKISNALVKNNSDPINCGVYKIPCSDCEKCYFGETGRTLEKRLSEHKSALKNHKLDVGVTDHVMKTGHSFDFKQASII